MNLYNQLTSQAHGYLSRAKQQFAALSRREQSLIVAAALVAGFVGVYSIYEPIGAAFDHQAVELAEAQNRAKSVPGTLERFLKFQAKRDAIEGRYRKVEFEEGALSHLENLIRTKAMISSGFTIKDSSPRPFGGSYEQVPLAIRFSTSNLETLVDFLNEIVHGSRP
ncbi:MAG: hypothetical protein EBZ48_17565, partial [Proteobacteria bacterium]|nr:hypothetical protein [Pseudomonadota bacterium]